MQWEIFSTALQLFTAHNFTIKRWFNWANYPDMQCKQTKILCGFLKQCKMSYGKRFASKRASPSIFSAITKRNKIQWEIWCQKWWNYCRWKKAFDILAVSCIYTGLNKLFEGMRAFKWSGKTEKSFEICFIDVLMKV